MDVDDFTPAEIALVRYWISVHSLPAPSGCIEWAGLLDLRGTCKMHLPGRRGQMPVSAYRVVYMLARGHIPSGFYVCHECDNRQCVNINHLWLGTAAANSVDMALKGRHPMMKRAPGLHRHAARITPETVREVVAQCRAGIPRKDVMTRLGVTAPMVSEIMSGRTWSDVTGIPYKAKHVNLMQIYSDNPPPPRRKYQRKTVAANPQPEAGKR